MTIFRPEVISCAGADDANPVTDLIDLMWHFPRLEIAVQFSTRRAGSSRYPSMKWLSDFSAAVSSSFYAGRRVMAALHVNGEAARRLLRGDDRGDLGRLISNQVRGIPVFGRIQINTVLRETDVEGIARLALQHDRPFVLQANPGNAECLRLLAERGIPHDILHDASRGRGTRPARWPAAIPGRMNAWAGGISLATLEGDLPMLAAMADAAGLERWGIDAESGLRNEKDRFSPLMVVQMLMVAQGIGDDRPPSCS